MRNIHNCYLFVTLDKLERVGVHGKSVLVLMCFTCKRLSTIWKVHIRLWCRCQLSFRAVPSCVSLVAHTVFLRKGTVIALLQCSVQQTS